MEFKLNKLISNNDIDKTLRALKTSKIILLLVLIKLKIKLKNETKRI